ncbi:Ser-Thr-rich GPI-anchored membrane family protein, partial [Okeania sp. KiyG1]|uniref:Ser-Thr-rich GPI-anchored membrane family protein n=1 Tax=Okeania sp. KiyG1 TaxID=2720165 RepID=UPI001922A830
MSKPKNAKLGDKKAIGNIKDNDNSDGNFENASNLGRLNGKFINTDEIGYVEAGERDTKDFYRFRLPDEGKLRVVLDELLDDANIRLYGDDRTLISTSTKKGTTPEKIVQTLDPGVYYLEVSPFAGDRTDYRLELKFIPPPDIIKPQGSITVNSPNKGNTLEPGESHRITWNDNISENVKLELYKRGSFHSVIDSSTPSDGSYRWTVPTSITDGSDYKVKITSVS